MKFEELIKKIEVVTQKIESGKLSLDESIHLYEEAMKDCMECYDILNTAKGKIEVINKEFCDKEHLSESTQDNTDNICSPSDDEY